MSNSGDYGVTEAAMYAMQRPMYQVMSDYVPPQQFPQYQGGVPGAAIAENGVNVNMAFGGIRTLFSLFGMGSTVFVGYFLFKKYQARLMQRRQSAELLGGRSSAAIVTASTKPQMTINGGAPAPIQMGKVAVGQVSSDRINMNVSQAQSKPSYPIITEAPRRPSVTLYQVSRGFNTPSVSPFLLKLETFMRIAKIPYRVELRAPVEYDRENEMPLLKIGDAAIFNKFECIEVLSRAFDVDLNKKVSKSRKAAAAMAESVLDSKLFWAVSLWRWIYDNGRSLPLIQPDVPLQRDMARIKEGILKSAHYNGIGNKSQEEVMKDACDNLGYLSLALSKHKYFLGDTPGVVDAQAFAILSQLYWNMPGSTLEAAIKQQKPLVDYLARIKSEFWPDWADQLRRTTGRHPIQNQACKQDLVKEDMINSNYLPDYHRPSQRESSPFPRPQTNSHQGVPKAQSNYQEFSSTPAFNQQQQMQQQLQQQQEQLQQQEQIIQQQQQAQAMQRQSIHTQRPIIPAKLSSEQAWETESTGSLSIGNPQMSQNFHQRQMQGAYPNKFQQIREHLDSVSQQLGAAYGHHYSSSSYPSRRPGVFEEQDYAVYPVRTHTQSPAPQVFGSPSERMERAAQIALNKLLNNSSSSGMVYSNNPGGITIPFSGQQQYQQRNDDQIQQGGWS